MVVLMGWVGALGGRGRPAEPLQVGHGWTQLPDGPLPPEREFSVAFWAGELGLTDAVFPIPFGTPP